MGLPGEEHLHTKVLYVCVCVGECELAGNGSKVS